MDPMPPGAPIPLPLRHMLQHQIVHLSPAMLLLRVSDPLVGTAVAAASSCSRTRAVGLLLLRSTDPLSVGTLVHCNFTHAESCVWTGHDNTLWTSRALQAHFAATTVQNQVDQRHLDAHMTALAGMLKHASSDLLIVRS